jgi:hypothetical protein
MASGSYDRSGALGPAAAFDAEGLLSGLADRGVSFEIEGRSGVRAEPLPRL